MFHLDMNIHKFWQKLTVQKLHETSIMVLFASGGLFALD